jgi:hypothetical protein
MKMQAEAFRKICLLAACFTWLKELIRRSLKMKGVQALSRITIIEKPSFGWGAIGASARITPSNKCTITLCRWDPHYEAG